jgi:hypothetical protein
MFRQKGSTDLPIVFFMADETDHETGLTGLTCVVTLSKNGGTFGAALGAVSELGSGWYSLAGNATDRDTIGVLAIHVEATGADDRDLEIEIVSAAPNQAAFVGTWTFTPDFTLVRDQIRQMIGDVISTDPLISDEALAWFYLQAGSDLVSGALKAAKAAAAKLALEFDRDLDGLKTSRSQRHKAMLNVIEALENEAARENATYTAPEAGQVADVAGYPDEFEPTVLVGPDWEDS